MTGDSVSFIAGFIGSSFSKQVEVLKKIPLPPMLGQSVFSGPHNSLYEWISAQVSGEVHGTILLAHVGSPYHTRMTTAVFPSCGRSVRRHFHRSSPLSLLCVCVNDAVPLNRRMKQDCPT